MATSEPEPDMHGTLANEMSSAASPDGSYIGANEAADISTATKVVLAVLGETPAAAILV